MKDIYELLNETKIDVDDVQELEVSEREKAKVKKALRVSLNKKKQAKDWKKRVVAASIITFFTTVTIGLSFPTHASNIPIIGDIFSFFDQEKEGLYTNYKDYSSEMDLSQKSNGINVTINDAIFDGKTVAITFSIDSKIDLGENPSIVEQIDIKETSGATGSIRLSRVKENQYIGLITSSIYNHQNTGIAHVKWNLRTIMNPETGEKIKGNWNFALSLQAIDNQEQLIGQSVSQDGIKVLIEKLAITPVSFIVYYNQEVAESFRKQWHDAVVTLEIQDDLGNIYSGEENGGTGKDAYDMNWSATFEKLDSRATKLIISPRVTFRSHDSDNHGEVDLTEKSSKQAPIPEKSGVGTEEFLLESMIINLKK